MENPLLENYTLSRSCVSLPNCVTVFWTLTSFTFRDAVNLKNKNPSGRREPWAGAPSPIPGPWHQLSSTTPSSLKCQQLTHQEGEEPWACSSGGWPHCSLAKSGEEHICFVFQNYIKNKPWIFSVVILRLSNTDTCKILPEDRNSRNQLVGGLR